MVRAERASGSRTAGNGNAAVRPAPPSGAQRLTADALGAGATPHAAFVSGYSAGLAAAAALVLTGGAIALRALRDPARLPGSRSRGARPRHPAGRPYLLPPGP